MPFAEAGYESPAGDLDRPRGRANERQIATAIQLAKDQPRQTIRAIVRRQWYCCAANRPARPLPDVDSREAGDRPTGHVPTSGSSGCRRPQSLKRLGRCRHHILPYWEDDPIRPARASRIWRRSSISCEMPCPARRSWSARPDGPPPDGRARCRTQHRQPGAVPARVLVYAKAQNLDYNFIRPSTSLETLAGRNRWRLLGPLQGRPHGEIRLVRAGQRIPRISSANARFRWSSPWPSSSIVQTLPRASGTLHALRRSHGGFRGGPGSARAACGASAGWWRNWMGIGAGIWLIIAELFWSAILLLRSRAENPGACRHRSPMACLALCAVDASRHGRCLSTLIAPSAIARCRFGLCATYRDFPLAALPCRRSDFSPWRCGGRDLAPRATTSGRGGAVPDLAGTAGSLRSTKDR